MKKVFSKNGIWLCGCLVLELVVFIDVLSLVHRDFTELSSCPLKYKLMLTAALWLAVFLVWTGACFLCRKISEKIKRKNSKST